MATLSNPAFVSMRRNDESMEEIWERESAIFISVGVAADANRIFQALTIPEYLEAWIRLPDQVDGSKVVVSQESDGYRLDHTRAGDLVASIRSTFLFCHHRKMQLFWQSLTSPLRTASRVDFRIRGNFGSSILELRHRGLSSFNEFLWHQQLWCVSLARLTSLLKTV